MLKNQERLHSDGSPGSRKHPEDYAGIGKEEVMKVPRYEGTLADINIDEWEASLAKIWNDMRKYTQEVLVPAWLKEYEEFDKIHKITLPTPTEMGDDGFNKENKK